MKKDLISHYILITIILLLPLVYIKLYNINKSNLEQAKLRTEIQNVKSQNLGYKAKIQQIAISHKLYVYSAYLDSRTRDNTILRVIGNNSYKNCANFDQFFN